MKILAATPKKYSDTVYIVELSSSELQALLLLGSYDYIKTRRNAVVELIKRDELAAGDSIDPAHIVKTAETIRELRSELDSINKAIAQSRTSFTKLQKLIPHTIP